VSRLPSANLSLNLVRHEGLCYLSAFEAMVKGALESELEIAIMSGPRQGAFSPIFEMSESPAVAQILKQHGLRLAAAPEASRAVWLAGQSARSGRAGIALVPNDQLDQTIRSIEREMAGPLDRGGAMCVVLEDRPKQSPASCPRRAAGRLKLPCIEPADVDQLRSTLEYALRLSRAGRCVIGLVVHSSILRSADTLAMRPNRVGGLVEALTTKRKKPRTPRWTETGGWLRMARRLELNRFRSIPNPGERVAYGFIAVGPADSAMLHIVNALKLHGRVPILQLGLIHPVDDASLERLLTRCEHVIVIEPRPGSIEASVLAVAESLRRSGEQPARVWGKSLPPDASGASASLESDDDLHPSVLVRKIAHLLHSIRPNIQVSSQLAPDPPRLPHALPSRESAVGSDAAVSLVRRIITDVDQWLRDRAPLEERGIHPTALAIDGAESAGQAPRQVQVEIWEHRAFQHAGISAVVQAARDERPWIVLVCEQASEEVRDLERLARGAIPAERADRVSLEIANLNDRSALRDQIREASMLDRLTIMIIRDGPPAKYDVAALEQSLAEIDQLGFEPRQRLVRAVDELCSARPHVEDESNEHRVVDDRSSLQTSFSIDPLASSGSTKFLIRVRPLMEEVEVLRTRPPTRTWQQPGHVRLPAPMPVHAKQPLWRAHIAGFRRNSPGAATMVLCEAGRLMGFHVRSIHDPTPIGPGRRAWSQVLFTFPRPNETPSELSASIPYGEADLLFGLDGMETLRAIDPMMNLRVSSKHRTSAVVNSGAFREEVDVDIESRSRAMPLESIAAVTFSDGRLVSDFAAACRAWFHTDRVTDMAMLGAAFQLGLVPVTAEAIESAVNLVATKGFGRSVDAFEFGRTLAVDQSLFRRPKEQDNQEVEGLIRRISLSFSRRGWGGGSQSRGFSRLVHETLLLMPGLAETDAGRQARRDFVMASYRCLIWGGLPYAQQFAELVAEIYQVDRGDAGRALTRGIVLPLSEAMLIGDPLYVASMALSAEQKRRTRQALNVKTARGDQIERRYLTRFELVAFNRRIRANVRTSDWPARAAAFATRIVPLRWRGTRRERELREFMIQLARDIRNSASEKYDGWCDVIERLHQQALDNRLRTMAIAEIKMLVGNSSSSSQFARGRADGLAHSNVAGQDVTELAVSTSDSPAE
jgi:Pyruvate/2-oxoacid:ferredoxin oxidoreductase gamma subunit